MMCILITVSSCTLEFILLVFLCLLLLLLSYLFFFFVHPIHIFTHPSILSPPKILFLHRQAFQYVSMTLMRQLMVFLFVYFSGGHVCILLSYLFNCKKKNTCRAVGYFCCWSCCSDANWAASMRECSECRLACAAVSLRPSSPYVYALYAFKGPI